MKIAILVIIGFLLISGGLILASALGDDKIETEAQVIPCCSGGCSGASHCSNPSCTAESTGSCGCRG